MERDQSYNTEWYRIKSVFESVGMYFVVEVAMIFSIFRSLLPCRTEKYFDGAEERLKKLCTKC